MTQVCIDRIATAVPPHDVHSTFVEHAFGMVKDRRSSLLLRQLAKRSGIEHRYSFIRVDGRAEPNSVDGQTLFQTGCFPPTSSRMAIFERFAPLLLRCALDRLKLNEEERASVGHVIVTCCTGMYAPGLDFTVIEHLQLDPGTDRTMVAFMGCYAAINGLKLAYHIVRSTPDASVLMINLELCSLHFQETEEIEKLLSFFLFGDGCAASLIRAGNRGIAIDGFKAMQIPDTRDLICWRVGDAGFDMELSSRVPGELRKALRGRANEMNPEGKTKLWAVHPGGRSILDAVGDGLELLPDQLDASRSILRRFGNMSSATIMFVMSEMMAAAQSGEHGCAMSFGPGLTAETMSFHVL